MRSTSWRMWLLTMTCRPLAPHCSNSAMASARASGSRPFNGSSRTSTCGSGAVGLPRLTRLRQFAALPHALAVGGHLPVARIGEADGFERGHGAPVALLVAHAEHAQEGVDELITGEALGVVVELRAIAHGAAEVLGIFGRYSEHGDLALAGAYETGHQVHQRGLAAAVGANQTGDAGRDCHAVLVDAEHFP